MSIKMLQPNEVRLKATSFGQFKLSVIKGEDIKQYESVQVRLAFPMSHGDNVVSFRTDEGDEIGILQDAALLDEMSEKALMEALSVVYFMPRITEIKEIREEYGVTRWKVETDRGPRTFNIQSRHDVRQISKNRYVIRDMDGNRYEIKDASALDPKSLSRLEYEV